jgi:hypothetical protein
MFWKHFSPEEVETLTPRHQDRVIAALADAQLPRVSFGSYPKDGQHWACVCDADTLAVICTTGLAAHELAMTRAEALAAWLNFTLHQQEAP